MPLLEQGLPQKIESILLIESKARSKDRDDLVLSLWLGHEFQSIFKELLDAGMREEVIRAHLRLEKDMDFQF
jgi:hypothetical protein